MRWFNTAGPCQSDIHYRLPPLARLPKLDRLIAQRNYFVSVAIEVDHIDQDKEILIQGRDIHIDSLAERLRESQVKAILEPMLSGQTLGEVPNDDVEFLLDLGLCCIDETGNLAIANPIYRELVEPIADRTTVESSETANGRSIVVIGG